MADECRLRGISLCLDFVMNHTSEDHAWALRARAGEKEYMDRYYFYDNYDVPEQFEQTVPQVFSHYGSRKFHLASRQEPICDDYFLSVSVGSELLESCSI